MGFMIKIAFIAVPIIIIILGAMLMFQAAQFWLDVTGPPEVKRVELPFDQTAPITATAFVPDSVRPENAPIALEVEVARRPGIATAPFSTTVEVLDACDYLRVDQAMTTLSFDNQAPQTQSATALLNTRNMLPPAECSLHVQVAANGARAQIEIAPPVNAWTGHLLSLIEALAGGIMALAGLRGAAATILGV